MSHFLDISWYRLQQFGMHETCRYIPRHWWLDIFDYYFKWLSTFWTLWSFKSVRALPVVTPWGICYKSIFSPIQSGPQSNELTRGLSAIVSTFWRKVFHCRWQRSNEAVSIIINLTEEWFVSSWRTSICSFMIKILIKTTVG